jgi:predicted small secreted protein
MKRFPILSLLLVVLSSSLLSSCLTQRTVTQGGRTVKQDYVIKRPLKEVLDNSR